ncbi:MAG: hypothetical protein R3D62_18915 [Xanthobacteraceae bacterium]
MIQQSVPGDGLAKNARARGTEHLPTDRLAVTVAVKLLPIVAAIFGLLLSAGDLRAENPANRCEEAAGLAVLDSPVAPWNGAPLRVLFAVEKALEGELSLIAPDGSVAARSPKRYGGPPYFWVAEVESPAVGKWHATLALSRAVAGCKTLTRVITVSGRRPRPPRTSNGSVWPLRDTWDRRTENLFSAWIEKLFDAPLDTELSWTALHFVMRDPSRNVLFNHLGLDEDATKFALRPDCADLPYFLRAYFAFKMGLPFGYSKCSRGGNGKAPRCPAWWNIKDLEPPPEPPPEQIVRPAVVPNRQVANGFGGFFANIFNAPAARNPYVPAPRPVRPPERKNLGLVASFAEYSRTIANGVHSGSARTALDDNKTDFYPVALNEETLRPGVVYADPYGHILVLVRRVPQSGGRAGVFLAVDGQPDGTVARKRFWRGNFLFAQSAEFKGAGFKRFRPIIRDRKGQLRRLANAEIASNPEYGDVSLDQARLGIEEFYDRMDDVMSPSPLDPVRALKEAITSLEEQVNVRVTSVENGRKFQNGGGGQAAMPSGPAIFETTGAWESFSTPARDLRLLIALDVVGGFPDRVARRPERYAMPSGKSVAEVKAELQDVLDRELAARKFTYTRSDGSPWTLSLRDMFDRISDLEMAYNPNDCVELRWGAPADSEESSTCKQHAPSEQRAKMMKYREWFQERRRPPRA